MHYFCSASLFNKNIFGFWFSADNKCRAVSQTLFYWFKVCSRQVSTLFFITLYELPVTIFSITSGKNLCSSTWIFAASISGVSPSSTGHFAWKIIAPSSYLSST